MIKYNSLLLASNTELSDHRASYRALSEENEKLRDEKDTLLNIYNTVIKERENTSQAAKNQHSGDNNQGRGLPPAQAVLGNQNRNRSGGNRGRPFCHYFNNNLKCPFDGECRFRHEPSKPCKDGTDCQRWKCQFQHGQVFLGQENGQWLNWSSGRGRVNRRCSIQIIL